MRPVVAASIYVRLPQPEGDRFALAMPGAVEALLKFARKNFTTPTKRSTWLKRLGHPNFQ